MIFVHEILSKNKTASFMNLSTHIKSLNNPKEVSMTKYAILEIKNAQLTFYGLDSDDTKVAGKYSAIDVPYLFFFLFFTTFFTCSKIILLILTLLFNFFPRLSSILTILINYI